MGNAGAAFLPGQSGGVDFPGVEQIALLRRHLRQHSPETVALVTSLPPQDLSAAQWLHDNRAAWGIESGLHQRLDVSHRDDQCRVRQPHSMRVRSRKQTVLANASATR